MDCTLRYVNVLDILSKPPPDDLSSNHLVCVLRICGGGVGNSRSLPSISTGSSHRPAYVETGRRGPTGVGAAVLTRSAHTSGVKLELL